MRLTLRGWVAVAVVVVGATNAVAYNPRALNAVVIPIAVGLVVGTVQVWRISSPRIERVAPDDGFPGEIHTASLDIDVDRPFPATVSDALSPGLDDDIAVDSVVGDGHVNYEVIYHGHGPATLGPVAVVARDIPGLFSKSFAVGGITKVLVFLWVRSLGTAAWRDLLTLVDAGRTNERVEFDRLREYVPGNPLRDIYWKPGTKSGNLVVKAYDDQVMAGAVYVSAGATDSHEDAVVGMAAILCYTLLDAGVPVHLTPSVGVVGATPDDHQRVLVYLSRLCSGSALDKIVGVVVSGDAGKTRVALGGREMTFNRLHAERDVVGGSNQNSANRVGTR